MVMNRWKIYQSKIILGLQINYFKLIFDGNNFLDNKNLVNFYISKYIFTQDKSFLLR